jgi:hypothetical protein
LMEEAASFDAHWCEERWQALALRGIGLFLDDPAPYRRVALAAKWIRSRGQVAAFVKVDCGVSVRDNTWAVARMRPLLPADAIPVEYCLGSISALTGALGDKRALTDYAEGLYRTVSNARWQEAHLERSESRRTNGTVICATLLDSDTDGVPWVLESAPESRADWPVRVRLASDHGGSPQDFLAGRLLKRELAGLSASAGKTLAALVGLGIEPECLPALDAVERRTAGNARWITQVARRAFRHTFRRAATGAGGALAPAACFEMARAGSLPVAATAQVPFDAARHSIQHLARRLSQQPFIWSDHAYECEIAAAGEIRFRAAALPIAGDDPDELINTIRNLLDVDRASMP